MFKCNTVVRRIIFSFISRLHHNIFLSSRSGLPLYFANAIYAFEGIGVVLPLENQMKEPRKMGGRFGVINTALGSVTVLYMMMGFFGYWQFFDSNIEGSITLNLPQYEW